METTALTSLNERTYRIIRKMGGGTYGTVFQVESATSGQLLALKIGNRSTRFCCISNSNCLCVSPDAAKDLRAKEACGVGHEIEVLRNLAHTNIISLLDVGDFTTNANETRPFYVMPLTLHRTTWDMSTRFRPFLPTFIIHISDALAYLHDTAHIAHMDLTNRNILVMGSSVQPVFVICDFGAARPIDPATGFGDKAQNQYAFDCLTSHEYAAPEIFNPKTDLRQVDKRAADVWSFAMCILGFCGWFSKENKHTWKEPSSKCESFDALMRMPSSRRIPVIDEYINNKCISLFVCERMLRNTVASRTCAKNIFELFNKS